MSDRQALLLAIRAAPEDDLPRLAYADWLEEHGDAARAQFIRLQCRLARLEPDDAEVGPLSAELRGRTWPEHVWRKDLPQLSGIKWGPFTRGFVETVKATSYPAFQREADRIREAIHLREVSFAVGQEATLFRNPQCLEGIAGLSVFSKRRGGPTWDCFRPLCELTELRSLRRLTVGPVCISSHGAERSRARPTSRASKSCR